jgi:hypothetical protein
VATAMLSLTGPNIWSWRALWVLLAVAVVLNQPTVWTAAVTGLFSAGRGVALAATLCGSGIGSLVTPPLTYALIARFGWRMAYVGLAGCWALVVIPIVLLFFTSARDQGRKQYAVRSPVPAPALWRAFHGGVLTGRFLQLALAGLCIAIVVVPVAVTIVPILSANGVSRGTAASIASLLGAASITGRLCIGFLLDRIQGRLVAAICVCFPIVGVSLLVENPGSVPAACAAVLIVGLSLGAELDIMAYLTSRYFKVESFGLMFGTLGGLITLAGGVGPMILNAVYDATHSYGPALLCAIPICLISALLFLLLGPYPAYRVAQAD